MGLKFAPLREINSVQFTKGNIWKEESFPPGWGALFCTRSFYIMNQAEAFSSGFQTLCLLVMIGCMPLFWKFTWMKTRLHSTSQQCDAVTCHFFLLVFIATQTRVNNASAAASLLGITETEGGWSVWDARRWDHIKSAHQFAPCAAAPNPLWDCLQSVLV